MTKKVFTVHERNSSGADSWHVSYFVEGDENLAHYQARPRSFNVREADWRDREMIRLDRGIYRKVPDFFPSKSDHYVHVSVTNPQLIAYTQNDEKGRADIQTPMKPGKYLKKFFPHYSDEIIRDLATRYSAEMTPPEVCFAATAEDMEYVYLVGPHSCMAYAPQDFWDMGATDHPVSVYAMGGDLQLAYIERDGKITARAFVWPAKKIFGRTYGDSERLTFGLEALGYSSAPSENPFTGARLGRVPVHEGFLMPYVDHHRRVRDDGEFLILDPDGSIECRQTRGTTNRALYCPYQDAWVRDAGDWATVYLDEGFTRSIAMSPARREAQAVTCTYSGYEILLSLAVETEEGLVARKFVDRHFSKCQATGAYFRRDHAIEVDGEFYSRTYIRSLVQSDVAMAA